MLIKAGPEGLPAGALSERLKVMPNTLSTHLGILTRAGLAEAAREGRIIRYRARYEGIRELLAYLMEDCCQGDPSVCAPAIESVLCAC